MYQHFSNFLVNVVDLLWGPPLVIFLIGGGLYLLFISRLKTLSGFFHAIGLVTGRIHHKQDDSDCGQISHFKALTNALSATIGMGNIAGVAVAISQGGAGAIFWMWVGAIIGMNTKFYECTLSLMFRKKDHEGEIQGGPMFTIEEGLGKKWKFLAIFFAISGLIGTLSIFNANQMAVYMDKYYHLPTWFVGVLMSGLVAYILLGGVRRIADYTSKIVPFMCLLYVIGAAGILILNLEAIPGVILSIFKEAFTGKAAIGGAEGLGVMAVFNIGIKRATFSNEAGIGTAPMAHGNAKTSEPVAEGLVAMLGPFLDTIIVCTMTALVILISLDASEMSNLTGVLMTEKAFVKTYGSLGTNLLAIAVVLFAFSTILGMANYNQKCWDYLLGDFKWIGEKNAFIAFYILTIMVGSLSEAKDMVNLIDIGVALMAFPNMIATLILAKNVKKATDLYFSKYIK